MGSLFKIENDLWYRKGEEKGEVQGEENIAHFVVANLVSELSLSDEQAARIASVPIEFIRNCVQSSKKSKSCFTDPITPNENNY
jgi:hypothetical protein